MIGYLGAAFMGVVLGLLGGGGSILAVPVLVYLFGIASPEATFYSLLIVGLTAAIGSIPYWRRKHVELRAAAVFFAPALIGVLAVRRLVLPALKPSPQVIILAFAAVMLAAAWAMLRKRAAPAARSNSIARIGFSGLGVGAVTGFVGAGGGFLIVPTLVGSLGFPMEKAVGTSMAIIALNSLSGFLTDLAFGAQAPLPFLLGFTLVSSVSALGGARLGGKIAPEKLRMAFGWLVVAVAILMVSRELLA